MSDLLIVDASILTLGPAPRFIERGYVLVRDSWIVAVGTGDAPATPGAQIIAGRGKLLAPGLINAHTHSQFVTLAGLGDRLAPTAFQWLTLAYTARRSPAETRLAVMLTAWHALLSGTTALIDHFPGQSLSDDDLEAALAAWHETGLRATVAVQFSDTRIADGEPPAGSPVPELEDTMRQMTTPQPLPALRDMTAQAIMRWQGRDGRIDVCPAPSNPEHCTDAALLLCAQLAERYDTGIHTHLLATKSQAHQARQRYGTSAIGHLVELGVLSDRWSCAHCVWLDDADRSWMAQAGAVAVLNPESNARLGVGAADIAALRQAGVTVGLGTDGIAANGNLSMHEAMRAAAAQTRSALPGRADWVSAQEALAMATSGGAAALRQHHIGAIAPGFLADLVLYRLDQPAWVPLNDPVCQLVFSETGSAVDTVIVAGKTLLADGRPTRFDPVALAEEIREMTTALHHRNTDLFTIARAMGEQRA